MKATTFGKATVSLASALTLSVGLGIVSASATPAALTSTQEDPTTSTYLNSAPVGPNTLVGVGSDTTQDVEYGISQDLGTIPDGTLNVASWTATGTTPLVYRSGGTPASHPNGSGAGFKALEESIGLIPAGTYNVAKTTATVRSTAPTVSHLRIGSVTTIVTASGVSVSGTVGITVRTTTGVSKIRLSSKTVVGGKVTASLGTRLPRGTYYVWVSYSGNANTAARSAFKAAKLVVS